MNKTGTSTMRICFNHLGITPVAHPTGDGKAGKLFREIVERGSYEPALAYARRFAGFEDRPWNVREMYRRLDERFPDSKIILTVRDPEAWWRSTERWLTVRKPDMVESYKAHLRVKNLSKDEFIDAFLRYNREVMEYFANRDDFLVLDVCGGDRWEKLCGFLGKPVPDIPFPHHNRQTYA